MQSYLLVFLGGGIGAATRYWMSGLVHERLGSAFPYGTLAVNILGCFVIGLIMGSMEERFLSHPSLRMFLTIGILGGFTTFSSFSYETIAMLKDGEFAYASLNVFASVLCCLSGTWLGLIAGRTL
ncbi:MAG: camphor resistance protein CrcB [Ignavibacteria bacterium GWA2_54_16]|nr:MAG: camphor resistance protein CrcB [Ignavibacteria bacterium GWA2_54_16]